MAIVDKTESKDIPEEERIDDLDDIKPSDRHRPFSVAMFKRWRKSVVANLNELLNKFHQDLVTAQARVNLVWNANNAVLRALYNKGLINDDEVRAAGAELLAEVRENIERAKAAAAAGSVKAGATKVPIEHIRDMINEDDAKARRAKAEQMAADTSSKIIDAANHGTPEALLAVEDELAGIIEKTL